MKIKLTIAILFLINLSFAQNKYDFDQFVNEGGDYLTAPLDWKAKDFLLFGLAAGATIGAMQLDKAAKEFTQTNRPESSPIPILAGRFYGEPLAPFTLAAFFIINGNSNNNSYHKKLGFEIAQASFYSVATTFLLKIILGRERPYRTNDNLNFTGPTLFGKDFFSLPSGHTTLAFALSTVLSENSSSDVLKVVSYLPAFLTAYSRVYENQHWISDVLLGGIIGFTTAKFFVQQHTENKFEQFSTPAPIYSISIPL